MATCSPFFCFVFLRSLVLGLIYFANKLCSCVVARMQKYFIFNFFAFAVVLLFAFISYFAVLIALLSYVGVCCVSVAVNHIGCYCLLPTKEHHTNGPHLFSVLLTAFINAPSCRFLFCNRRCRLVSFIRRCYVVVFVVTVCWRAYASMARIHI